MIFISEYLMDTHGGSENKKKLQNTFNFLESKSLIELANSEIISAITSVEEDLGYALKFDYSNFRNSDFKKLISLIEDKINNKINLIMSGISSETVLLNLLSFANVLSKLTFSIYADDDESYVPDNDIVTELGEMLRNLNRHENIDMREPLGELKKIVEICVNYILFNKNEESYRKDAAICYREIFAIFDAKLQLNQIQNAIPLMGKYRNEFEINYTDGIKLPNQIYNSLYNYVLDTKHEKISIENDLTNSLFEEFKKRFGFEPRDLGNYLLCDAKKVKFFNPAINICNKKILENDMKNICHLTSNGVFNIIQSFILNKPNIDNGELDNISNPNSRLFRAPLIELEDSYLIPTFTFSEAFSYFQFRILNRDLFFINNVREWNELIKNKYDEYYLPYLKEILENHRYINVKTNLDLAKNAKIKEKIENLKKFPHEIDLCYIDNSNNLIIKDLKNYHLQHNFNDARKTISKIKDEIGKLKKLQEFIYNNIQDFENIFGCKINNVYVGVLTVNLTIYNYLSLTDEIVRVLSIDEFIKTLE